MSQLPAEKRRHTVADPQSLPEHLRGMGAPLAVWEYVFALKDRVKRLEGELAALRMECSK